MKFIYYTIFINYKIKLIINNIFILKYCKRQEIKDRRKLKIFYTY